MNPRVVVIAGASSGIGAALADRLGRDGTALVLSARREAELRAVAARAGRNVLAVPADLTRRDDVRGLVAHAIDRFGHIDVWVNNVGRGITRMPTRLTDDDIHGMMQVNVMSAFYGMQEVLPHFQARNTGHIINVSSMLGRVPFALQRSAYSAAKHFLNCLTANFRSEIQATHPGIQISIVSPGVVATEFGLHAEYGGVDSRTIPGAQTAEHVADVIAATIETRQPDVYTRGDGKQTVLKYYEGI